ncbi:hypothetical protein M0M57_03205 [Flavobacterium azooxidireducens]|uniref:Uncharacterized protein n=1 Tax=Flavobacterium azooxidireducens TaxID=1871076 RepID=A0ABY4KGC5_9FLAO|nr:hypothetical protein [Flavobacterium azooxidireducens]UPQ79848.1 hypothetical protein M0M57_03205 [Flavobacterium azooxidireducens]
MDSIEIKLKKDSTGRDISLGSMSLDASKSIREILDALIAIVEFEQDLNLKIGLEEGSAVQKIIGSDNNLQVVYNKIKDAADGSPQRLNKYVNSLNIIYKNLESIEDYDISYKSNRGVESIKPLFTQKFRSKRNSDVTENNFNLEFFSGKLELNGGKKPNFHLFTNNTTYTIQCSEKQAKDVGAFLYENIKISAHAKAKKDSMEYNFCDIYVGTSEGYFNEFKDFYTELKDKSGTQKFHFVSNKLEQFYNQKNYSGAKKFIRLFLNEFSHVTYLRTILVISKAFKNDEYLGDILSDVEKLLSKKIGKAY